MQPTAVEIETGTIEIDGRRVSVEMRSRCEQEEHINGHRWKVTKRPDGSFFAVCLTTPGRVECAAVHYAGLRHDIDTAIEDMNHHLDGSTPPLERMRAD